MKCNKCGKEFEGNFCPQCGSPSTKNNLNRTLDNPEEKEIKKGFSSESKDVIGGAINLYLHSRLKYIFLGAFVSAFCMFSIEKIISGLALTILVQKFLNKWTIFLFCSILFSSNQKEH